MEFIRIMSKEEIREVSSFDLDRAKKAIGQEKNEKLRGVGDTLVVIKKAKKDGLYKAAYGKTEIFYAVVEIINQELAVCYSVY